METDAYPSRQRPRFFPGRNIAMKVPPHEYHATVAFYRDVLCLRALDTAAHSSTETTRFDFGGKTLWIDKVPGLSQAEIWLEVVTDDLEAAAKWLDHRDCVRRDEIEPLPDALQAFWISNPANIIHLVDVATLTDETA